MTNNRLQLSFEQSGTLPGDWKPTSKSDLLDDALGRAYSLILSWSKPIEESTLQEGKML